MLRLSDHQEIPSTLRNPTMIPMQVHTSLNASYENADLFHSGISRKIILSNSYFSCACFHPINPSVSDINCKAPRYLLIGGEKEGIWSVRTVCSQPPHFDYLHVCYQCPLWRYQCPLWRYSAGNSNFSLLLLLSVRLPYRSCEIYSVSVNL
jgi:hypothetical protein